MWVGEWVCAGRGGRVPTGSHLDLEGSASPSSSTWLAAARAKISKKRMKARVSRSEPVTRSLAKRMVRISLP
jgi:hypothetical protein